MTERWLKLTVMGPLFIGAILIFILGLMLVASVKSGNYISQTSLENSGRALISVSSNSLFNPLYNLDVTAIEIRLKLFIKDDSIAYVAVRDTAGHMISEVPDGWIGQEQPLRDAAFQSLMQRKAVARTMGDRYLVLSGPIAAGSEQIGTLEIVFDQTQQQAVLASTKRVLIAIILGLLIGTVLISVALHHLLLQTKVKPLKLNSHALHSVSEYRRFPGATNWNLSFQVSFAYLVGNSSK